MTTDNMTLQEAGEAEAAKHTKKHRSRKATTPEPAEPPAPEAEQEQVRDPIRSWEHDNLAGVQLLTYSRKRTEEEEGRYEIWLKFRDGKPSDQVRKLMKDNGFEWHGDAPEGGVFPGEGAWTHPVGYNTGAQDRLQGERVYQGVVNLIRAEKGIEPAMSRSA